MVQNSSQNLAHGSGCTFGVCALSFIVASAIPFFNYLLGLIGSLCCAPLCVGSDPSRPMAFV